MAIHREFNALIPAKQISPESPETPEFLAQLLRAVQHSIIAVDREERITFWNDLAHRFYGFTKEEALGRKITELTANSENEGARSIMDEVWGGNSWTGEYPVSHRDGSFVHARVRLFPIFDQNREVSGIVGVSEDISAEVAGRRTLQQTQERFELIARSTSDAVWDWEVDTDTLWGNAAYEALAGPREPGVSARDSWFARIHPEDRSRLPDPGGATTFTNEYRFLNHATGKYARVLDRGFFIRDADGKLRRVVGAMTDISHIFDIQQAFRASEERFRLVFEESPMGIVLMDESLEIVQTNGAFRRMLGDSTAKLEGRTIIDLTHPEDQGSCSHLAADLFHSEEPFFRIEKRYLRQDGGVVWGAVTATMLPSLAESGARLGLALIEDVTEQRRVQDELRAAKTRAEAAITAKMRFLAQISHEIRSPMNGVLGMLELLEGSPLEAEQRDHVTAARQAATSLLGMLEEILDLTRLDQQRLALHPREYSPLQLLQDVSSLYRVKTAAMNVALIVSHSGAVPAQHVADPSRVRQILINLLENAIKFTGHGGISVTATTEDGFLSFIVEDTGIGIPPESLSSVFETFSTISAHTSASVGGTGLGLAISQRLARLMGGDITVASLLGHGSRFTLSLPLHTAAEPARSSPAPLPIVAQTTFPGRRILVVEDNPINQRVAAGMLRRLGCEVDIAENGIDGLGKALATPYDVILMDAMMPIMDGFEATIELRRREPGGRRVPVIGLTALATEEDRRRCLEAGMDDYLPKPANFSALSAILGRWLPVSAA